MIINVHAGHNPDGKTACGAVGIIKESTEARNVKDLVISKLKSLGHTVYDCTVDNGTSQSDVLKKIVAKCNAHKVDLDISIHFNSGRNDYNGDGSTGGTEVFTYSTSSKAVPYAQKVAKEISALGYRLRDDSIKDNIKTSTTLYFLKNSTSPAMLIECCFVDDADDIKLYSAETMATAIVKGITGNVVKESTTPKVTTTTSTSYKVRIQSSDGYLNVRRGPGTSYAVVKNSDGTNLTIKTNEVYTIVETSGSWGKLKSGAGWIYLLYTVKL